MNWLHLRHADERPRVANGLAHFLGWNFVFGFRRIVYCPFRTLEPPSRNSEAVTISWGGAIAVLRGAGSLRGLASALVGDTTVKRKDADLWDFLRGLRLFVDVATPKVMLGDWKYFQRNEE